jgi:formylglycine-generating enzyme required for sulfatase activity
MVCVPGGKIRIGEQDIEVKPFCMGATEVTWDVFDQFLISGEPSKPYEQKEFPPDAIARPSRPYILPDLGWGHAGYPVINVHTTNVEMFLRWLRLVTGKKYRLATEAEWELAASAATTGLLGEREWFADNAKDVSHPVGKKLPNAHGLHDMLGNVGEWATDLSGKPVLCGGDFTYSAADLKPTVRRYWSLEWQVNDPQLPKSRWWLSDGWFVGFRLVCDQ